MSTFHAVPSISSQKNELADYVEIECIKNNGCISYQEIISILGILKEEDHTNGVAEDDPAENVLDDLFIELERRKNFCNGGYPFCFENHGYSVRIDPTISISKSNAYKFMLFATWANMRDNKIQNKIDGTLLFEELSEKVANNYFGERTETYLFGTSNQSKAFADKIDDLIEKLGEGVDFLPSNNTLPSIHKDDCVDVIAWKSFSDKCHGKLIGFGQCKTGINWRSELLKLNPEAFCKKWFRQLPAVTPVRLFFIADGPLRDRWYEDTANGGILFDRFRIIDYLPEINESLYGRIIQWNEGVMQSDVFKQ